MDYKEKEDLPSNYIFKGHTIICLLSFGSESKKFSLIPEKVMVHGSWSHFVVVAIMQQ